jgi:hypothetical protein
VRLNKNQLNRERYGLILIACLGFLAILSLFFLGPFSQEVGYHNFSDRRTYFLIPNTLNVLSNLPFIIVGFAGLVALFRRKTIPINIVESNYIAYVILYGGAALVGVGSSYYHLWPSNETLVWDRLPMTMAFMALYSIIICEFISERIGRLLLVPFLLAGLSSVLYWWFTEFQGRGDLRFYVLVQFFPIVTIPIILLLFKSKYSSTSGYWVLLGSYVLAKLFEHYDTQIQQYLVYISGHSIKHVFPAIGLYLLLSHYKSRRAG